MIDQQIAFLATAEHAGQTAIGLSINSFASSLRISFAEGDLPGALGVMDVGNKLPMVPLLQATCPISPIYSNRPPRG